MVWMRSGHKLMYATSLTAIQLSKIKSLQINFPFFIDDGPT